MATNPMQRKARMSFILGMLVMLLICGAIIAFLFIQLSNYQKKEKESKTASVQVYTLNQDVRSGQVITSDMYTMLTVNKDLVPSNATSDLTVIENYALQDKEGNDVYTKDSQLYIQSGNKEYKLNKEDETDNFYIEKNGSKEYIELNSIPLIAKVTMKKNTIITKELVAKGQNELADDMRTEQYNSFVLPMDLQTGDYVDVRLMLPSGQNFIVVSKKEVQIPTVGGADSLDTVIMNVSEEEILTLSSAILDAYRIIGSKLYVTKYTEAGMQKAATPTYVVTAETAALMNSDPNILNKAKEALRERYRSIDGTSIRNQYINKAIDAVEGHEEKLQEKMQTSIENSQSSRQKYLDSLSGGTVEE